MKLKGGIDLCPSRGHSTDNEIIVVKIGGSCLKDGVSLRKSLDKVEKCLENGYSPIVVLSALNGLTDNLLDIIKHNVTKDSSISNSILSEGELLSTRIINKILTHKNFSSKIIDIDRENFPIVTSKEKDTVNIDIEETRTKLQSILRPLIEEGTIPIIPGFVGKTKEGKITTLGRGGSDTTAVLVGSIMEACEVVLLKDVPGILRCDPNISMSDEIIDKINVHRAVELGLNGGKVINPDSLKYKRKNTDIRIVDYDNDDFLEEGTRITGSIDIITETDIHETKVLISLVSHSDINNLEKYRELALNDCNELACSFKSNNTYSICIEKNNLKETVNNIHGLIKKNDENIAICYEEDISLIEINSNYLPNYSDMFSRIHQELRKNSISVVNFKTDSNKLYLIVKNQDIEKLKNILKVIR